MTGLLEFTVMGKPAPQGSKTGMTVHGKDAALCHGCGKRHIAPVTLVESSAALKPWRAAVTAAARQAAGPGWAPLRGPLALLCAFTIERPVSHYRTGRYSHLLSSSAPLMPTGKPDLSKLIRAAEDAITDAGVWADDALVTEHVAVKVYADGSHPWALPSAGAWIRVSATREVPG